MDQGELCPRECRCWNSIYDTDSKVIIGTASAGLGLIANRALERDRIIAAFGESIILRGRAADEAHELIINFNTMCTVGRGFQYSIRRKLAFCNTNVHGGKQQYNTYTAGVVNPVTICLYYSNTTHIRRVLVTLRDDV
jgi:hypothetical protein